MVWLCSGAAHFPLQQQGQSEWLQQDAPIPAGSPCPSPLTACTHTFNYPQGLSAYPEQLQLRLSGGFWSGSCSRWEGTGLL